MIDYDKLKSDIISLVNTYVVPEQLNLEGNINTYDYPTLIQGFIPFSSEIKNAGLYCYNAINSPTPIIASILDHNLETVSTTQYTLAALWNEIPLPLTDRISKNMYYLKLDFPHDTISYAVIGTSTVNTYTGSLTFGGTVEPFNLSFAVETNSSDQFVHKAFPSKEPKISDYPIVTLDITSRPRVNQRWLDPKRMEELITVTFEMYSRYPIELDLIAQRLEKAMFRERTNLSGVFLISPGSLTQISKYRDNIFTRSVSFTLYMIIQVE